MSTTRAGPTAANTFDTCCVLRCLQCPRGPLWLPRCRKRHCAEPSAATIALRPAPLAAGSRNFDRLGACSEGGFFKGTLTFPQDYPNNPPEFRFTSDIWHPNGAHLCTSRQPAWTFAIDSPPNQVHLQLCKVVPHVPSRMAFGVTWPSAAASRAVRLAVLAVAVNRSSRVR